MDIYKEQLIIRVSADHSLSPGRKTIRSWTATYALKIPRYTAEEYDQLLEQIRDDLPGKEKSQIEYGRTDIPMIVHPCPSATVNISSEEYEILKKEYSSHIKK